MIKRVGLWAFLIAGVAIACWGVASWISPVTSCRGVEMGPGDVCETSNLRAEKSGKVQTYENRIETTRQQSPFAVLAGVVMAGFGGYLISQERRDQRPMVQASSDIGP